MSDIFALNFDGLSSPSIKLKLYGQSKGTHTLGWGFGWYPNDNQAAILAKNPVARDMFVLTEKLSDWENFRSTIFVYKVKGAAEGYTHHETQPFSRSFAGRDWLFMHNGDLDKQRLEQLSSKKSRFLEPLGKTDSEMAFCYLLSMMHGTEIRKLSDVLESNLLNWFEQLDKLGSADMVLTDGTTIACYHGTQSPKNIFYKRIFPNDDRAFDSDAASLALLDPRDTYRTALIFCSMPFNDGNWEPMQPNQLILARRGDIVWSNKTYPSQIANSSRRAALAPVSQQTKMDLQLAQVEQMQSNQIVPEKKPAHESIVNIRAKTHTFDGKPLTYRVYDIVHTTQYTYANQVEHSTHVFRLQPAEDHIQEVMYSQLIISSEGEEIQFEDVFGNHSIHYSINIPYNKLSIKSKSRVKVYACPPDDFGLSLRRTSIPLRWMPWQRQMMMPYLLPMELPETQLVELADFAMSFVERNDYNLMSTLEDINLSIYRDFKYVQGTTSLNTTPFEVYANRQGVCQDFANLFICLAQLLGVPARYRMGYIYTGVDYQNKIQSEASHAWIEVYLPYIGWRGFDPTNGCSVAQDHIRVACGRNFRDATPTSGTIFKGGGEESLTVDVKIVEVSLS